MVEKTGIDPSLPARVLWLETHPLPTTSNEKSVEDATLVAAVGIGQRNGKHDRPIGKRGQKYKTKPIIASDP
jgi:hypothetical protein